MSDTIGTVSVLFGRIVPVFSVADAQAQKLTYLHQSCSANISAKWDPSGQANAALTLASGADSAIMSMADAKACLAWVGQCVTACRTLESEIAAIVADSTKTDAQKVAGIDAINWVSQS